MIPAAGAPGTAGSGFRVAREAADDVAGRLVDVLTLRLSPSVARYLAKDLLPVVEQIAEERARQAWNNGYDSAVAVLTARVTFRSDDPDGAR